MVLFVVWISNCTRDFGLLYQLAFCTFLDLCPNILSFWDNEWPKMVTRTLVSTGLGLKFLCLHLFPVCIIVLYMHRCLHIRVQDEVVREETCWDNQRLQIVLELRFLREIGLKSLCLHLFPNLHSSSLLSSCFSVYIDICISMCKTGFLMCWIAWYTLFGSPQFKLLRQLMTY